MANPKEFNFTEVMKKYIKEGKEDVVEAIDFDSFKKEVDENYVNEIVNYRTSKAKESVKDESLKEAQLEVLRGLGIESNNLDEAKAWANRLKSTTTEKDEIIQRLENEKNQFSEYKNKYEDANKQVERYKVLNEMDKYGVKKDYREDVYDLAQKRVTDEKGLEDVLADMRKTTHTSFFENAGAGSGVGADDPDPDQSWEKQEKEWDSKYLK